MSDISSRKIFIGGLSYSTDDDALRNYFAKFGAVADAVVMKDSASKRSRGFGFITFESAHSVDLVLVSDVHIIDNRRVEAKRAVPRSEVNRESSSRVPSATPSNRSGDEPVTVNKIFVGGLHYETRDDDFKKYFERFGKVLSAEVMFNRETQKSRGFGFIVFDNEEAVERVLRQPTHIIDGKMVEVKRAIPRSKIPSGYRTSPSAGSDMRKNSHASLRSVSPTESFHSLTHTASFSDLKDDSLSAAVGPMDSRPAVSARATHEASYAAALCNGGRPTRSQSEPAVTGGVIAPPDVIRRGTTETHSFVSPSRTATLYDVSTQGFSVGDSLAPDSDRFGAPGLSYPLPEGGSWAETPTAFPTSSPGTWMPSSVHASPSSSASRSLFSNGLGADFSPPPRPSHTGQRMHSMSSDGYALTAGTDWGFSHALGSPHTVSPGSHLHGQSAFLPGGRAHSLSDPVIMPSSSPWTQLAAAAHDPLPPLSLPPPEQPGTAAQSQQHYHQQHQQHQHQQQQHESVFFGERMQQQRSELPTSGNTSGGHPGLFPAIGSPVFPGGFGESSGGYTSETFSSAALSFSHL